MTTLVEKDPSKGQSDGNTKWKRDFEDDEPSQ